MKKIVACYKWVTDEADIRVNETTLELDFSKAKKKIGEYDRNALEAAVQLHESAESSLVALTYGSADAKGSLQEVLARGADEAVWVTDDKAADMDARVIGNVLAKAIEKIGDADIIVCGDGSSDESNQQVPLRIASVLGLPVITGVVSLKLDGDAVTAVRRLDDKLETVSVAGAAVYSVLPEIAQPRIPGVKQIMAAKKKAKTEWPVADLALDAKDLSPKTKRIEVKGYRMSHKNVMIAGDSMAQKVAALVENLKQEGVM